MIGTVEGATFGPAGYVKFLIRGTAGQANHLNQTAAYKEILKRAGSAVELDGNAFIAGTEHNQFHVIIEKYWSQFRGGGANFGKPPSNQGYLQALREALSSVKVAGTGAPKYNQQQVDAWVKFAEEEQRGYGYFDGPGGQAPKIPGPMNLK
jgi:hypothetical protein